MTMSQFGDADRTSTSRKGLRCSPVRRGSARWWVATTVVGLSAAVVLSACGSSSPTAKASASSSLDNLTNQQLLAKANQEGTLTIYTPNTASKLAKVFAAFNKTYPGIKVHAITLDTPTLVSRVTTEQRGGKYSADLLVEDSIHMSQLISAQAITPYNPPTKPPLPPQLNNLPAGFQSVAFLTTNVIAYNPQALAQHKIATPTSFQDLTGPAWKGNFLMTPNGADLYTALSVTMGQSAALKLIQAMGDNNPRLVASHSQGITQVESGDTLAALSYGAYAASAKKKNPASLDFVNPVPLPSTAYFMTPVKNAPHPAAARIYEDWYLSQAGQNAMISAVGFTSLRSDADNDPAVWDPSKWQPVFAPEEPISVYNERLSQYKAAVKAP